MKPKIVFVERKFWESVSLEKVFEQIDKSIPKDKFETLFVQLPYLNNFLGIVKNFIFFKKPEAEIYHITGHIHYIALILPRKKTVLTVADLTILRTRKGLRRFIIKKLFFDLPIKKTKYITAISEATKNEIVQSTNCEEEKIRVIEIPLQDILYSESKKTFNTECPTILQIGTAPHKNITNLVRALKGMNCLFRIIGKLNEELLNELKLNKINFTNDYNLDDVEIKNEYQKADIVAFCSTTKPAEIFAIFAASLKSAPAANITAKAAITVSPAPVTS